MIDKFLLAVAALAVLVACFFGAGMESASKRADRAEAQVVSLQLDIRHAQELSDLRAESAKAQLAQANTIAAGLNRQAATILQLPTPAPADRCDAAQALTDSIIREERP
ncbi:hypothetical protein DMC25_06455 [Caulobacter sp. D4A]|uniref:hypothetical protein n=1 Tax=unclassified Caulobacter TaxID=2648921 RepID=UPI000D72E4B9|nr:MULTISPECIES: hypothetical protein [unclassified Caulobacter]PXA91191.1 hypothetical protein DMC25_06455 [Caulobacter sp. D4A]PXA96788.1 hypothetical protein DMC18_00565 [Caulobacter sp. D5]